MASLHVMRHVFCLENNGILSLPINAKSSVLPFSAKPKSVVFFKLRVHQLPTTTSPSPNSTPPLVSNPLVVEHLINEYGVSRDKAISASTRFSRSISLTTLSSVPDFLKQNGFSDTHIRNLISKEPRLLCSKIDKTLKPKLELLKDFGFSDSSLADLITHIPNIFCRSISGHMIHTIDILRSLLHSNDNILKVLNRNPRLFGRASDKIISRNVAFFRQCGLSDSHISFVLLCHPRLITLKTDWLEYQVNRVESLGFKRDSATFVYVFGVIASLNEDTLKKKFDLYKSYGWSESDILSACSKAPGFLSCSDGKIRKMMSFLMDELELDPKDIAEMPQLFKYSLEKRLKPRCKVMKILNSQEMLTKEINIRTIAAMSEKRFLEEYVVKFVDRAPDVGDCFGSIFKAEKTEQV